MSQRPIHFKNIKENNTQTRILIASSRTFAAKFSKRPGILQLTHANSKAAIKGSFYQETNFKTCSLFINVQLARPVIDVSYLPV